MQKYSDEVRELIARKAYEYYEQRGRQGERDVEDWLQAERTSPQGDEYPSSYSLAGC